jgi:hypothetical protein
MYILFVAPPGRARKSTTVNYAETLLHDIPKLTRAPEVVTQASLLQQLVNSSDASVYITAPEFGEFIMKSGLDMYGFLTNLFDGKRHITASTISRGHEFAEKPCINLLGATTPEWIAGNMPASVIGGGFASRVIFIYEDQVRERRLIRRGLDGAKLKRLEKCLTDDLADIALNCNGVFDLTEDAEQFIEAWYQRTADVMPANAYRMHGYYERKPAHVMKVAMLLHLAYSNELMLQLDDIKQAIEFVGRVEKNMPKVFMGVGKNPYTYDMDRIEAFIREKKHVDQKQIIRNFYSVADPSKILELLNGLVLTGSIKASPNGTGIIYSVSEGSSRSSHPEKISASDQPGTQDPDQ